MSDKQEYHLLPLSSPKQGEEADKDVPGDSEEATPSSRFIPGLHGMRGLAAMSITFGHAYPQNMMLRQMATVGFMAFCMLSGHLITGILLRTTVVKVGKARGWLLFALSRIVRIYPALLITTVYSSLMRVHIGHEKKKIQAQAISALLQVENFYINEHSGGFLTHTWYIGMEQQFYAIWPIFVALIAPRGYRVRALAIMAFLSAISIICRMNKKQNEADNIWFGGIQPWHYLVYGGAMQLIPLPTKITHARWLAWFGILMSTFFIFFGETKAMRKTFQWIGPIFVFCMINGCTHHGNILLEHPSLVFMGRISYAYFLYHLPLMATHGVFYSGSILAFYIGVATFVPAAFSTLYIEEPLRDLLKARFAKGATTG